MVQLRICFRHSKFWNLPSRVLSIDVAGRHYALSILVQVLPMSLGPKNRTGRSVRGTFMNFENVREECVENAELPKAETTDLKRN